MRRPAIDRRLGLGLGLDMHWDARIGFEDSAGRARLSPRVQKFLGAWGGSFSHVFLSWQPRDRGAPRAERHFDAFDAFFDALGRRDGADAPRALHHTALNLGTMEPYDRRAILAMTNQLIERYDLRWVNEDLGLWSIGGRPLPYPLPPILTKRGLDASIANAREVQRELAAPLSIEFPGFSEGLSVIVGSMHAYDFFRRVVEDSESVATLDVGHLLSYQWRRGRRGEALYEELDRLPLESTFELHLSGCSISGKNLLDLHHGVLLDEQFELVDRLLERCPNLRAITYEDPKFDAEGALYPKGERSAERLRRTAASWAARRWPA